MASSPAPVSRVNVSRKPRPQPERRAHLEDGMVTMTFRYPRSVKVFHYHVAALASDFGAAFRLDKFLSERVEGEPTGYDVLLDGERSTCECLGFSKHGHCKHVECLRALQAAGRLPALTAPPRVEVA